jgi:hypothetical protein
MAYGGTRINMPKLLGTASLFVVAITFLLFLAALFLKGLTHDLFLEAGIFQVSDKIIMMSHRNSVAIKHLNEKLNTIMAALTRAGDENTDFGKFQETPNKAAQRDAEDCAR